ncbi:GFA family protein [Kordiimonas aquimaris]|uniref:GFA family protein n=1 Tax=Kordiimonas aquimaris TaxID=707591 RepID=UPI0021CFAD9A|nr:GFA family protein [Kordiimonas aquimaris]
MRGIREGGCSCGAARYQMDLTDAETGNCHCRDCQKQSGAPFATVITVKADQFKWLKQPEGETSVSDAAIRRFCNKCGTPLQWCGVDYTDIANINMTTLDDTSGIDIVYEIYTRSRVAGILPVKGAAQSMAGYADLK